MKQFHFPVGAVQITLNSILNPIPMQIIFVTLTQWHFVNRKFHSCPNY